MRVQRVITQDRRGEGFPCPSTAAEHQIRSEWAQKIREEFGKYHEHGEGGGECAACGAIEAANWMDPGVEG